jgi:predicted nucleotidyltransferase component of viral defense system
VIDPVELADVAAAFGVADAQVRRDHLISHALSAIAGLGQPLTFFGGTALARTHICEPAAGARLSEDIDLYSPDRRRVAKILDDRLPSLLRREFPGTTWDPPLSAVRAVDTAELVSREGIRVRIQLLYSGGGHHDLARWPTEVRTIDLRYRDLPDPATLRVPTLAAFAAMKTIAWADRHTARDLYDLARIAGIGGLTQDVATQVRQATGWSVLPGLFSSLPPLDWTAQLGHQTATLPTAEQCLIDVRQAFAAALDWPISNGPSSE